MSVNREVICFSISWYVHIRNVMRLAAEELEASDLVTVIDSANLSTGIGLLVIEAAIMAQEGKTAGEITAVIEELKQKYAQVLWWIRWYIFIVRALQCCFCHGRKCSEAASQDRCGKWCNGCLQEISWKTFKGDYSVCERYGEELKAARPDRVFITHSVVTEKL